MFCWPYEQSRAVSQSVSRRILLHFGVVIKVVTASLILQMDSGLLQQHKYYMLKKRHTLILCRCVLCLKQRAHWLILARIHRYGQHANLRVERPKAAANAWSGLKG